MLKNLKSTKGEGNTLLLVVIILLLLVVAGGGAYYFLVLNAPAETNEENTTPNPNTNPTNPTNPPASEENEEEEEDEEEVTITYDGDDYTPDSIEIKKGTTITFVNESDRDMWPASDPHPIHTDLFGFDPRGPISPDDSWSYTFQKTGNWEFHDHLRSSQTGKIIVTD